jgi:phosphoserine phosphatase RsbU/P
MHTRLPVAARPIAGYVALGTLFIAAVAYQVRFLKGQFPGWFGQGDAAAWPFVFVQTSAPTPAIAVGGFLSPEARQAGLQEGDILLAVNGRPLRGTAIYGEEMAKAHAGDLLGVTVRARDGQSPGSERSVAFVLEAKRHAPLTVGLTLFVAMPAFCILLGFWVAAVRPRDSRAWLLLALLLCLATLWTPGLESWGPGVRDLAEIYRTFFHSAWPVWMVLLGIYFPEPFPSRARWRWWDCLKWGLAAPLALYTLVDVALSLGGMEHFALVAPLQDWLQGPRHVVAGMSFAAGASLFFCAGAKLAMAVSPDAKRRLRLLLAGAIVSLAPLYILFLIALLMGQQMEQYFPQWLFITAYVMLCFFPLTLAYVIVVQRAMDVRVVIRQGLQYAFATRTIQVLRVVLSVASLYAVVSVLGRTRNRFLLLLIIGAGVAMAIWVKRLIEQLKAWIDRRFFRDAYNAEIILSELSEKVRTIVKTEQLLETVSRQIADSLHVPKVAVLVDGKWYRPAYALGFGTIPDVGFPESGATVRVLRERQGPVRVYFDDPDSWIYRTADMTDEDRGKLATLRAELLLPLAVKGELLGFVSLSRKRSEEPYSGIDLRLLGSVAAQTGLALENARLAAVVAEEVAERKKLHREIEIAREVQERLFPQELPPVPGIDYCGKCRPALVVGGDYYDFLPLGEGKLGVAIGDVSGKGISAALMMASLQGSLRGQAMLESDNLASLMKRVNHLVYGASGASRYATFFYSQYEPGMRRLTYVNAGHNPPFLVRMRHEAFAVERLDQGGPVIGLMPDVPYEQASVTLYPGDVILAYTDGVSEGMNPLDKEWGEESLLETAKSCLSLPAEQVIDRIMNAADAFAAGAPQYDDMTLVVIKVQEQARSTV